MPLVFAPGTPAEARSLMMGCLATPDLPAELRAAIERLAGNETMQPFWKQLPASLHTRAADIIYWAVSAYIEATSLEPPRAVIQKEIDAFLRIHAPISDPEITAQYKMKVRRLYPLTYDMLAEQARILSEMLDEIPSARRRYWAKAWPGDPEYGFDKLRLIVGDIAACCDRLDADARQIRLNQHLPDPPRKRGAHTAQHVYFDRILKTRFREEFGQLYPGVVATLEQVAFDLPDAVDESTVLKR